jgi:hypothetical protein
MPPMHRSNEASEMIGVGSFEHFVANTSWWYNLYTHDYF